MRKSLVITLSVLVGAAAAWAAPPDGCQYHQFKVDTKSLVWIDSGPYDICWDAKTDGTLNGRHTVCWYWDDLRSSDSVYGDGWGLGQIEVEKFYSRIETNKGDLELTLWGWWDGTLPFSVETGFAKVVGGTGAFEGAEGSLSWAVPSTNRRSGMFTYKGYICTP